TPRSGDGSGTRRRRRRQWPLASAPRDASARVARERIAEGGFMSKTGLAVAVAVAGVLGGTPAWVGADVGPGTTIDQSNADQVKDVLPPEIYKHYKNGDYTNPVVDFPVGRFRWDDGFDEATRQNGERLTLDENKQ